mgnify:CR=1 FL=1
MLFRSVDNPAYIEPFGSTERCVEPAVADNDEGTVTTVGSSPTCAELGGECVFRYNTAINDCVQGAQCIDNADLTVVDSGRRSLNSRRRMEFIEGCSCALPKQPSESPSVSIQPTESPSSAPTYSPSVSSAPNGRPTRSKKEKKSKSS